jgi:hypothetical protein
MADVGDQNQGPEPYQPSYDAPTTPFQRVVLPSSEETTRLPRPRTAGPFKPPAAPPRLGLAGRLLASVGDVPIKVLYLAGAVVVTILAVVLVFVIFSGDRPETPQGTVRDGPTREAPQSSGSLPAAPTGTVTLPPVPAALAFPALPGKATTVIGLVTDERSALVYPRLGKPWTAKSFAPFVFAQRAGEVALPHTLIASALLPGETPKTRPAKPADYRDLAARAARWSVRTQHPPGSVVTWTGSRKVPEGKGWMLGYTVEYTLGGKRQSSRALVAVVEIGKAKPAMLLATIPESGRAHWRDINTLADRVRPI